MSQASTSGLCPYDDFIYDLTGNGSNASHIESRNDATQIAITVFTSFLSFLILVGNGLIIVSVAVVKKLRQPANYLIVSLASSDFLVGLIVLPLTIVYDSGGEWIFGWMICDVHVSLDVICCTASIMNLCIISIDRYMMITKPMTYPKRRSAKFMVFLIATAWIMSCITILPALFGFTKNVKDDPFWIKPTPVANSSKIQIQKNPLAFSNLVDDSIPSENWSNGAARYQVHWSQIFELDHDYIIWKFRYLNPIDKDVIQIRLQGEVCEEDYKSISTTTFLISPHKWGEEVVFNQDFFGKFLRLTLNSSASGDFSKFENFELFVEKVRGKSCLISQEVWFTIYSTVGAFYIPLVIMLIMYWKIYREASKFRSSTPRTTSNGSQDLKNVSAPSLNSRSMENFYDSTPSLCHNENRINNNPTMKSKYLTPTSSNSDVNGSGESLVINNCQNTKKQNQFLTTDKYHPVDDVVFDDEVQSSLCEICNDEKDEPEICITSSDGSCECRDLTFLDGLKETFIGDEVEPAFNDSSSLTVPCEQNRKYSVPITLTPPSDECASCKVYKTGSRTWSSGDIRTTLRQVNSSPTAKSISFGSSNNCSAFKAYERFPPISENNVVEFHRDRSNRNKSSTLQSEEPKPSRLNNETYTEPSRGYDRNKPRHSIFSGTSMCACRPLLNRNGVPQIKDLQNGSLSNQIQKSKQRKSNSFSRYSQIGIDRIRKCINKKGTVFKNIRRRVSSSTSRERLRNVKATRTLGIIVGVFTFCWLPFFIVTFIRPFICENPESQDCIPLLLVRIVLWLGYVNSALNPLIYIGFSPDLRKCFRYLLSCKCTNVDRRLAQQEFRSVISREKRSTLTTAQMATESIM